MSETNLSILFCLNWVARKLWRKTYCYIFYFFWRIWWLILKLCEFVIVGFIMRKLELELRRRIIICKWILELIWCGLIVFNAKSVLLEVTLVYVSQFLFQFFIVFLFVRIVFDLCSMDLDIGHDTDKSTLVTIWKMT